MHRRATRRSTQALLLQGRVINRCFFMCIARRRGGVDTCAVHHFDILEASQSKQGRVNGVRRILLVLLFVWGFTLVPGMYVQPSIVFRS